MNSKTTIIGLVAAVAVLSGAMGMTLTGVFDDQKVMTSGLPTTGFLMGQVEIEARNADGELFAYRLGDNEVVDDGEQCILKMLFATTNGVAKADGATTAGDGACTGALNSAWNVIAIGTYNEAAPYRVSGDNSAVQDVLIGLGNETGVIGAGTGLDRGYATGITWSNGTADSATKLELSKTFTLGTGHVSTVNIGESGLFNSTTGCSSAVSTTPGSACQGMLARQAFTDVALTGGDSITVTWTFTVGN